MSDPTSQPPLPGQPPAWQPENEPMLQYGVQPQQPQYYQQPQYQQPQYQTQQPFYEQLPHNQLPQGKSRAPWLVAGAIALAVALVGGAGVLVLTRSGGNEAAGPPVPTGSYTDGLSNSEPSADPSTQPSTGPSDQPTATPRTTPKPSPTPVEKRRTLKDVDQGIKVYDDVYVNPAKGWRKFSASKYAVAITTDGRGAGYVVVLPAGYPAASILPRTVTEVSKLDRLIGLRLGPVKSVRPANSNIGSQAQVAFSARLKHQGVTYSLIGRCTTMTGVESIHNVTVTMCVETRKETSATAFRDYTRMLASVARSI